ncbi:MAG: hypothetical protein ACF8NJ_02495 [Phycisphaerales bacterium JB038]
MHDFDSPVELAVNTNRLFMEGLNCMLDLRLRNRSDEDRFTIQATLRSRLLDLREEVAVGLLPGEERQKAVEFFLPTGGPSSPGSAGDVRFLVDLSIDAGAEGQHLFQGEFVLHVLKHSESRREINVNIGKVIEQHGDSAGMGAINEIDMSKLVQLPEQTSVNELIGQKRPARFVPIALHYEGHVGPKFRIARRVGEPVTRCALAAETQERRTIVVAGEGAALGCGRDKADIVTWVLPRSAEADMRTRHISRRHCEVRLTETGAIVALLSRVNPAHLNDEMVSGAGAAIPGGRSSTLRLPGDLEFTLTTLPHHRLAAEKQAALLAEAEPNVSRRWEWAERLGVGGVRIERTDCLRERESYVVLFTAVALEAAAPGGAGVLLSAPHLAVLGVGDEVRCLAGDVTAEADATPLRVGDQIAGGEAALRVGPAEQILDC